MTHFSLSRNPARHLLGAGSLLLAIALTGACDEPNRERYDLTGVLDTQHSKGGCWENGVYNMYCDIPSPINVPFSGHISVDQTGGVVAVLGDSSFHGSRSPADGTRWQASVVDGDWLVYPNTTLSFVGTTAGDSIVGTINYSSGYGGPSRQGKSGTFKAHRR